MSANDEMRMFLSYLVQHQQECTVENCVECQTAKNIYDFARNLIFSVVAYPEVVIPAGRRVARTAAGAASGRKTSRRAA